MKKIILFVVCMFIVIMSPRAIMFSVTAPDDFESSFGFFPKEITGENTYLVSFHWNYEIDKPWLINNLAYYGTSVSDEYTQYAIQKLILELVNPTYNVIVQDDLGNTINLEEYEELVLNEVSKYNVEDPLNNEVFQVNVFDSLEIKGNHIDRYEPVNTLFLSTLDGMKSEVFTKVERKEIKFKNRLFIEDDHIYSNGYVYKPFSIYVDVLGNTLTFNTDYTYNGLSLEVYSNNTLIDNIYLNDYNKVYYYKKGLDLKFVDVTNNGSYELLEDIYVYDESKELNLDRVLKDMNLTIKAFYKSYDKEEYEKMVNVSLLDENFKEIDTCLNKVECKFILPFGDYYIKDLDTNYITREKIVRDRTIYLNKYLIDGFISEEDISYEGLVKKGNIYYLDNPINEDYITINGDTYNLKDYNNYVFINNEGLFYQIIKKDEVIKEEVKDTIVDNVSKEEPKDTVVDNESKEEVIEILVPDTNMTFRPLYVAKNEEDYYIYITNTFNWL